MNEIKSEAVVNDQMQDTTQQFSVIASDNFTRQNSLPTRSASGKRLIYCSDGVVEESDSESIDSSDAEREMTAAETRSEVPDPASYAPRWAVEADPKRLGWKRWLQYKSIWFSIGAFHCAEVAGEKLAWALGITSPKYAWEIEEYRQQRRAEKEEQQLEQEENEKVCEIAMRNMADSTRQSFSASWPASATASASSLEGNVVDTRTQVALGGDVEHCSQSVAEATQAVSSHSQSILQSDPKWSRKPESAEFPDSVRVHENYAFEDETYVSNSK